MITKKCHDCGETKPVSKFYKIGRHKDGLDYRCKACTLAYMKNYYKNKSIRKKRKVPKMMDLGILSLYKNTNCNRCARYPDNRCEIFGEISNIEEEHCSFFKNQES